MKPVIKLILCFIGLCSYKAYSQCVDVYDDVNNNPYVCGTYGDANGVSNWNWEITDKNNPNYCNMWYARTSSVSTKLTTMGSPFVDASTSALDLISQNLDFKKEKGWELLRRDFGCSHVTAYPYFVLYNKYTGLMRVYVYQPETQPQYSGILIQIEPTKSPWPATTALGDEIVITPDKYLTANSAGNYGKSVVAVSEPAGSSRWSVAEFNPAFDPNIENAIYSGTGLKFTVFGVLTFDIKAKIKGRSVSSTDPKVYNFNYVPTTPPSTTDGQTFSFSALGEKFIKFGKNIIEIRDKVNANASSIVDALPNTSIYESSLLGRIRAIAFGVRQATDNDEEFGKLWGMAGDISKRAGNVLKFVNNVIGLFTGIDINNAKPAPMPTYTSYDLVLDGTITAKSVQQSFILRVPGTIQTNNDNATYFKCPLGIVNLVNTPEADTVVYKRVKEAWYCQNCINTTRDDYVSYRMRNNLAVSYNDGAGLDLVSVQAALIGEVLPGVNGNASYNLLEENVYENPGTQYYLHFYRNFMRPDLEAGRLEMNVFDPEKGLHIFQTPYVNIECINGLTFNAVARTKVYLRLKAVLKKKNDPENTPIFYIKDYRIDVFQGSISSTLRNQHNTVYSHNYLPPYNNYTEVPTFDSDKIIENITYSAAGEEKADNSITTGNNVLISASAQNVVFKAGHAVDLKPGFEAKAGCLFNAVINNFGYNISCTTPQTQAYQYSGSCYNTSITALRTRNTNTPAEDNVQKSISIYPTLSTGSVNIAGKELLDARIVVADASGRVVMAATNRTSNHSLQLDLHHLSNGVYFIGINSSGKVVTRKILLNK